MPNYHIRVDEVEPVSETVKRFSVYVNDKYQTTFHIATYQFANPPKLEFYITRPQTKVSTPLVNMPTPEPEPEPEDIIIEPIVIAYIPNREKGTIGKCVCDEQELQNNVVHHGLIPESCIGQTFEECDPE